MKILLPDSLLKDLPEHKNIEEIPQAFSDSTHRLWRLQTSKSNDTNYFLKVCSHIESPFWQVMLKLFNFDLETEIIQFQKTYTFIDEACHLQIPQLIKTGRSSIGSFILTSELHGSACDSNVDDHRVSQLAKHLAELHSLKSKQWGSLNTPKFTSDDWVDRLKSTLLESHQKWGGVFFNADDHLEKAISACDLILDTGFVPMIPDLRWDQFLQLENNLSALIDLDAFVYAPRELDFIILEYILSDTQCGIFKSVYSKYHTIPDLEFVRHAYRLLLFYMKILGEADLQNWMNHPNYF